MLKNLKIGTKLFIVFALLIAGLMFIGIYGMISINAITDADNEMYENNLMGVKNVSDMTEAFYNLRIGVLKTLYEDSTAAGADKLSATLDTLNSGMEESIEFFNNHLEGGIEQKDIETLNSQFSQYQEKAQALIKDIKSGSKFDSAKYTSELAAIATTMMQSLNNLKDKNMAAGQQKIQSNAALGSTGSIVITVISVVFIALAIVLILLVVRSITKPLGKMVNAASKLAAGDTEVTVDISSKDEVGMLAQTLGSVILAVKELIADANMLSEAAVAGKFDTRADTSKHQGDYKKIVNGVNATLDTVVDKIYWYESLLDAIPFPISVTDIDMNWTFVNKPVEQMLSIKRAEVLGKQCENWNANICNTENCGIARLRKGLLQTEFEQMNSNFQVDTSYLYNLRGEKIGHIEVVQDITRRIRSAQYSAAEVDKLAKNLKLLSQGDLNLALQVSEGDEYTKEEKKNFEEINQSFQSAVDSIAGYITEITQVLQKMADGDMTSFIAADFKGDFSEIKESVNSIVSSLNHVLLEINTAADQVASGTRQVSDGNQAISQGATEQASSIEELSASITQIAAQTAQNASNASTANELALGAKDSAAQGNEQMKGMQKAMTEINEASQNISKIIKVIDDIAFQTNILALNAAVEAARAGEHGKGFAVVAEEVRNLAARSAQAAKETTGLIESSIKKTEAGTQIANVTATSLEQIVKSVDNAAQLVGEIATASSQQATGITQVNKGIDQLSQVVQNNSATAEEGAASSEELSSQAELLKNMVAKFKLARDTQTIAYEAPQYHTEDRGNGREQPKAKIILSDNEYGKY
jgi:methyl-accepting chemotaxis protein